MVKRHDAEPSHTGAVIATPEWVGTPKFVWGSFGRMKNGLRALREGRGWTVDQAAKAFDMSPSGYVKIERGERKLDAGKIQKACDVYNVAEAAVLGRLETVPVVGYVGAGNVAHYYGLGDAPDHRAERPPESTDNTVAVEIRGDSLYPIAEGGDLIYYDEVKSAPTEDLIGRLCVVGLEDDRILVKRLHPSREPGCFDLLSPNAPPMPAVRVVWAARVKWIKPR